MSDKWIDPYFWQTAAGKLFRPFGGVKSEKTPLFGFLASSLIQLIYFAKKIESKRPTLPSAGSETIYSRLYGVVTANSDDPYRNPNMNNKDHRVG